MTGYSEKEVVGKTPRILQGPNTDKEELGRIRTCLEQGVSYKGELINYRKNGEEFWTSLHISPILDVDGGIRLWIGIKRDISRMKENEERLRAYGEKMEEMVQARTIALADAHNKLSEQYD
ncbi:MAG: PAS domain S-box protein, partial [Flavobacteriales bacterium]|nr:PAS domain S-box protein [Flavobacteriales bacterium]